LFARKEIVLSAGSFGTPALLQLSGIGHKKELKAAGIQTIVNNPSVGHNLSDHTFLPLPYLVNSNDTYDPMFRNLDLLNASIAQWTNNKTGPLAGGICNHLGWLRLPGNATIFKTTKDPAAGPNSSHYEMILSVRTFLCFIPISGYEELFNDRTCGLFLEFLCRLLVILWGCQPPSFPRHLVSHSSASTF